MAIQAIETVYAGCRFRSRLEARWAVFYDTLRIPWQYEREGYDLGGGLWYLPDFWLPKQECWVEIKPGPPSGEEEKKVRGLVDGTDDLAFVFWGDICVPADDRESDSAWMYRRDGWDNYYTWCECTECGAFGIEFDGRSDRLPCKECSWCAWLREGMKFGGSEKGCPKHGFTHGGGCRRISGNLDKGYNTASNRLVAAYTAARSARF